jgi:hypothetical protein
MVPPRPSAVSGTLSREIHVDQNCRIVQGSSLQTDPEICHLESVHTSNHIEETINDGAQRNFVQISEQDYLLQDVTTEPVTFVVEHFVPKEWQIDSDPQPTLMNGSTAVFRVNAQPGQIVRLHVGMRNSKPVTM